MYALGYAGGSDKRYDHAPIYSGYLHKQISSVPEFLLIIFGYIIRTIREFHLYKMDNLIHPFNNQIDLRAFPLVTFWWNEPP